MTGREGKPAKVSLARITIDARPEQVTPPRRMGGLPWGVSFRVLKVNVDQPLQVYEKLAQVGSWNNWHTSAWVLRPPGLDKLAPGEKFAYTAPFVLGNIQSQVEESHEGKVGLKDTLFSSQHSSHCYVLLYAHHQGRLSCQVEQSRPGNL